MIQTINPYSSSKTAEIMSRYRPIAPRPETLTPPDPEIPTGIQKSPYLRNVWAHLQSRPTRTRKRGRAAGFAPPPPKRARPCLIPMHGFLPINCPRIKEKGLDLNLNLNLAAATTAVEELDLLPRPALAPAVISPRPVRPVGSSVVVEEISDDRRWKRVAVKTAEEVEEMVEAEKVPMIVSDSNNKVRMCNSAYRELVGQPECGWLDCAAGKQRRIGGEISLEFVGSKVEMSMHGFKCRVKIEWERKGVKRSVNAVCHGVKLACPAKDYQFLWSFYETESDLATTADQG